MVSYVKITIIIRLSRNDNKHIPKDAAERCGAGCVFNAKGVERNECNDYRE